MLVFEIYELSFQISELNSHKHPPPFRKRYKFNYRTKISKYFIYLITFKFKTVGVFLITKVNVIFLLLNLTKSDINFFFYSLKTLSPRPKSKNRSRRYLRYSSGRRLTSDGRSPDQRKHSFPAV